MFKPEDNHYSRFIDALQVCDEKYLDSDECKKHYKINWWLKYNYLAVKESTNNITIFNRIPKEILKSNGIIPYLTNVSKDIFNEYYRHTNYKNICALWLHKDTTDEIKEMCGAVEEKHINHISLWLEDIMGINHDIDKCCVKIIDKNIQYLSKKMFGILYYNQAKFDNRSIKIACYNQIYTIPNCAIDIFKKDDLLNFKKFLIRKELLIFINFIIKYKSLNILKYIMKMDYKIFEDNNILMHENGHLDQCLIYNLLTESSTIFMLKYLPIYPFKEYNLLYNADHITVGNILKKHMELYEDKEKKKLNYLSPILKQYQLSIIYTYKINKFIDKQRKELNKDYGVKNAYFKNYNGAISRLILFLI